MSILEKLQSDMEDDAYFNLPLEERYDLLKRDAETIAQRLDAVVAMLKPAQINWNRAGMDSPEYHAWCLIVPIYARAVAIAEGREP